MSRPGVLAFATLGAFASVTYPVAWGSPGSAVAPAVALLLLGVMVFVLEGSGI